jgi:UMF1 family MFS transporter
MTREDIWGIPMDPASRLPDQIFFICGALIGAAGGSLQAASRTMMARHTSPDRATEAFGLYALSGKVASFMAPALIALATTISGSQQIGFAPLVGLFLIGLILLTLVNPNGEMPA